MAKSPLLPTPSSDQAGASPKMTPEIANLIQQLVDQRVENVKMELDEERRKSEKELSDGLKALRTLVVDFTANAEGRLATLDQAVQKLRAELSQERNLAKEVKKRLEVVEKSLEAVGSLPHKVTSLEQAVQDCKSTFSVVEAKRVALSLRLEAVEGEKEANNKLFGESLANVLTRLDSLEEEAGTRSEIRELERSVTAVAKTVSELTLEQVHKSKTHDNTVVEQEGAPQTPGL